MVDPSPFATFSPTTLAEILGQGQVMAPRLRPLFLPMRRIAGPAYTVHCPPNDHLMVHAAIHRAPSGSVLVVDLEDATDASLAMAGGNVCAVAQRRGIAGFVVDGTLRDIGEIRSRDFPVFARGVFPVPGRKEALGTLASPIVCGGVRVHPGDIVVADEEGIVVVPRAMAETVEATARKKVEKEAAESLDTWEAAHRTRIDQLLKAKGYVEP